MLFYSEGKVFFEIFHTTTATSREYSGACEVATSTQSIVSTFFSKFSLNFLYSCVFKYM